jgi:muconolactone delta-isomerase
MQFAVLTRRKTDQFSDTQFAPLLEAEGERVRELYAEGFIRQVWMRGDTPGAFQLVEATDEDEAREKLHSLPLHKAGMLELIALVPLKPYRAFCPQK